MCIRDSYIVQVVRSSILTFKPHYWKSFLLYYGTFLYDSPHFIVGSQNSMFISHAGCAEKLLDCNILFTRMMLSTPIYTFGMGFEPVASYVWGGSQTKRPVSCAKLDCTCWRLSLTSSVITTRRCSLYKCVRGARRVRISKPLYQQHAVKFRTFRGNVVGKNPILRLQKIHLLVCNSSWI